jgi:RNA polymerase sigma factor (sigma-70 family)
MNPAAPTDPELLADWLDHRREAAFRELVARYAGLVQMTARRTCGDDSLATEAAQLTFIALAQKARSLVSCAALGGWLHQTAMLQAKNLLRKSQREHRKRELLQTAMETESPTPPPDAWQDLQPVLDDALAALSAKDREALLLRFYRSLSVKEIATTLGIATDAAQKRVDRATDRLRGKLVRRGLTTGSSLSAVMLAGFAGDAQAAAPMVSLFVSKSLAVGSVSTAISTTTLFSASAMKATSVAMPLVVLFAGGIWLAAQFRSIAELEKGNSRLQLALTSQPAAAEQTKSRGSRQTSLDRKPVDWVAVVRQLRNGNSVGSMTGGFSFLNTNQRLLNRFDSLSRNELIAHWDDLDAAGLPQDDAAFVRTYLIGPMKKLDPGYVVRRVYPAIKPGDHESSGLPSLVAEWTLREPDAAVAWLDARMADGAIPAGSKPFEVAVISSLMPYDLDAAAKRLELMPKGDQNPLWEFDFGQNWGAREKQVWKEQDLAVAFARLARILPEKEHHDSLAWILTETGEAERNGMVDAVQSSLPNYGRSIASMREFFDRIQATPAERRACVEEVLERGKITKDQLLAEYPDALR